ncbi:nucleotide excision repair endonuclease [Stutzerimonas stutzeri]|uniref:nucleotide excision repair endonuclease n=1 Tax=Stutzerimonas stutzeri TaxID=316 RepID=UPI003EE23476
MGPQYEQKSLSPLASLIVDRAIENTNRKLIAGFRNKNNSRPNAKTSDPLTTGKDTLAATSSQSAMDVANRGVAWKEILLKSLSAGIGSLATLQFDGEINLSAANTADASKLPDKPGVYVVYDASGNLAYIGDSTNMRQRWQDGHLNDHRNGNKKGEPYKLSEQLEAGCKIKFITMDSAETAAALEAHLIKTEKPPINKRQELHQEQGTRSNIEAKKLKDTLGNVTDVALGAGKEALKNSGWQLLEQLSSAAIMAIKDELVDVFMGGTARLKQRVERFLKKIWAVIEKIIEAPLKLLNGIVEFIVNALSKAIRQVYNFARNLFDLAHGAWQLYRGAQSMSREELIQKIVETVIVSGTLVLWDGLEPIIESQLIPLTGAAAPYISCVLSAIGFGLCSYHLQNLVPPIVAYLVDFKTGWSESLEAKREAALQLIKVEENEWLMAEGLIEYAHSVEASAKEMIHHRERLAQHVSVRAIDFSALLPTNRIVQEP